MADRLAWGLLAAGNIANNFAKGVLGSHTGRLAAIGSRSREKAEEFGDKYDIPNRHGSYEELLADPEVEAVYIATPHPMHAEWAWKAAEAKKHILCEKPICLNHADAMRVIDAAVRNDVFLMEAFMYRCHPQTHKVVELVRDGAIGAVRMIQATFSFHSGFNPDARLFSQALGGGGILDVGCYPVSFSRLIAGVAQGKDFLDPTEVRGAGHLGETGIDEYAAAVLLFPGDIIAQVATGVALQQDNAARIYGSEGNIVVPWPWTPGRDGSATTIVLNRKGKDPEEIAIQPDRPLYGIEADTVAENIERRQAPSPAMSWDDTLGNMKTLDLWRESVGLVYESEKPEAPLPPVYGGPLAVREGGSMTFGEIAGVGKKVSRLVMGVDNQRTQPHANAMFDDYFERGGNCFDTGYVYGRGIAEQVLGRWVKSRGVREDVVIFDKGAHTPFCDPENLTKQLLISLERLQTDYVDIYMMHRDNPEIPVGDFVEVLNEHLQAGRMRAFGGSNWTLERVDAANAWAQEKGLVGFSAVSNNFSLARMIAPPWAGCIQSVDAESRAWFERTGIPLMPWSSQAQGFFVFGDPDKMDNAALARCWYAEDNFKRLERAKELAAKLGAEPVNVALAYVLCQPFSTFPLIGPRRISETRSSFRALEIQLSPDDLRWLNLED